MDPSLLTTEIYDFGPGLRSVAVQQYDYTSFHTRCLASSANADSTGLRVYGGSHCLSRLLALHRRLLDGKAVIELGCGTGALGICANLIADPVLTILTDGNEETLGITVANITALLPELDTVSAMRLSWGSVDDLEEVRLGACRSYFDVVLGCELMYYSTEVEAFVAVTTTLAGQHGVVLHAHIFRKHGQLEDLLSCFIRAGYCTYTVDLESFIDKAELAEHPDWLSCRVLLSGDKIAVHTILDDESIVAELLSQEFIDAALSEVELNPLSVLEL